jgi:hypothetical protein
MQVGDVIGDVDGAIDGNQRAMIDEPLTRYFQPTILPPDSVAAMVSR